MKPVWTIILGLLIISFPNVSFAQCCSVAGGSPVGGDASQGVLQENQAEINTNFQFIHSSNFLEGSQQAREFLDHYQSRYLYSRFAYGISKDLTLSIESGYFFNKTQVGLNERDVYQSSGLSDLIIFPRYRIMDRGGFTDQFEWTIGLGWKVPLGSYNDTVIHTEPYSGMQYSVTKPLSVQLSSGSNDFIFSTFVYKAFSANFRMFANGMYINKGWNPAGEKFGNYWSLGISGNRTLARNFSLNLQLKGEVIGKMQVNPDILLHSFPDYDPEATGSRKLFLIPALNYNYGNGLSFYLTADYPLYQYVSKTQVGSQYQFTFGLSYKFGGNQEE